LRRAVPSAGGRRTLARIGVAGGIAAVAVAVGLASLSWFAGESARPSAVTIALAVPKPLEPPVAAPAAAAKTDGGGSSQPRPAPDPSMTSASAAFTFPAVTPAAFAGLPAVAAMPLAAAPDRALVEEQHGRALPRIGADGRQPWRIYARPFERRDDRSRIAVVVTDLGLSGTATDAAIHYLPADITLAFDAYGEHLATWAAEARGVGHEVLLALPMQSTEFPYVDAGPQALSVSLRGDENRQRLEYLLGLFPGYVGVLSAPDAGLALSRDAMRPVLDELRRRGLLYLEAGQQARSTTLSLAADLGAVRAGADLWIDEELTAKAIDEQLARLESTARAHFVAVGIARPRPLVIQRLVAWAAHLNPADLVLAPVSAIAIAPAAR
jgi:polysaccharide deacetylase 2 family uncharacterized protein YibQ